MTMPILPVDAMVADCNGLEELIVRAAFTTRGVRNKSDGYAKLRSNKPFRRVESFEQGCANYVWRMLCFDLVGHGKHVCMPVCADFELSDAVTHRNGKCPKYNYEDRNDNTAYYLWTDCVKQLRKDMDALVSRVEKALPIEAQKGILRWGRALGYV